MDKGFQFFLRKGNVTWGETDTIPQVSKARQASVAPQAGKQGTLSKGSTSASTQRNLSN